MSVNPRRIHIFLMGLLLGGIVLCASPIRACDVPVFRYALERWPADLYEAIVIHGEALSAEDKAMVDRLEEAARDGGAQCNYSVQLVDLATLSEEIVQRFSIPESSTDFPWMVVLYPRSIPSNTAVWSGHLTSSVVEALMDSPIRRELAKRILGGESAVWVLLESGDPDKDNQAATLLETQLKELGNVLELPEQTYGFPIQMDAVDATDDELHIGFSLIRVSRTAPKDEFLVNMLTGSEEDLAEYASEPMAFPIYGRGRILYALVGKGITGENIREACEFLVGPCSCQVKALNPGTDLLMAVDWERALGSDYVGAWEISQTIGSTASGTANEISSGTTENHVAANQLANPVLRSLWLVLAIIVIINILIGLYFVRRRSIQGKH
ncbi:MAG: hypothetical protein ABIH23_36110 [bacterium]